MWLPTTLYVFILQNSGDIDLGVVLTSYMGVLSIGASYLAIGLVASAMTDNQLVALLLSTLTLFGLFLLGVGERVFDPGLLRDVCAHVSVLSKLDEYSRGIVDSRRIVFDGSLVAFSLYLTVRVVDSWRQR
jgi:ABC-2 type transport system permease protein